MKGLYCYGICPAAETKKSLNVKGIGGGKVFSISYKDIEAIVSQVFLKEFESEEIQKRARESLEWIKNKALMHEKAIETAMNSRSLVIPMKFGTIFRDRESLLGSLNKDYLKFKGLLGSLQGQEEQSVKIYCRSELFANEIKKKSPMIQGQLEEIKSLPAGRQYFLEEQVKEMVKTEARNSVNNYTSLFLERLKGLAEELKENKTLGKELTGKSEPMIFNGAFLIKKEKVKRFQMEMQKLRAEYEKIGFTFESSGPWPPYNFVD